MAKQWRQFGKINGSDLGKLAIKVYLCRGCNAWFEGKMPAQCSVCGRMDFERFDSKGEAKRYMQLRLLQRAGEISELRRQVVFPLFTLTDLGKPVRFADYVADFVYTEKGAKVIEDSKSRNGITPEASLKLRVMEAAGTPVRLTST